MKINMWLIADKLTDYNPLCDIKRGDSTIEGLRFITDESMAGTDDRYLYLCSENEVHSLSNKSEHTMLIHGEDLILIQYQYIDDAINALLQIFDYYNDWENRLWEESATGSLQGILDIGTEAFQNPIVLADTNGVILAMSSEYRDRDLNPYWIECRDTGHLPTSILGMPVKNTSGEIVNWSEKPEIFVLPDGTKQIGQLLYTDGEPSAGISLWQLNTPISLGHLHLMSVLSDVLKKTAVTGQSLFPTFRSSISILTDLLNGIQIDEVLLSKLQLPVRQPWCLIQIDSSFNSNIVSKRSLISRMQDSGVGCIPLLYENQVLCLVSKERSATLLSLVFGVEERKYYYICVSMPFTDLANIRVRYDQLVFVQKHLDVKPGIYYGQHYALIYLLSLLKEKNSRHALVHPGLKVLKDYDAANGGDLYHSLFYYLYYDQSIQKGAEAVHVHRNSFLYRINRAKGLLNTDLSDVKERQFLLFSFLLEEDCGK